MKFCLTQAITHSPSSDFCEVPAQKDALNGEPEEASWDLQLWASPSTFVFWERGITEVAENSEYGSSPAEWGSPKGILVFCWGFFFREKLKKRGLSNMCIKYGWEKECREVILHPLNPLGFGTEPVSLFCSELQCAGKSKYDKYFYGSVTTAACRLLSTQELLPKQKQCAVVMHTKQSLCLVPWIINIWLCWKNPERKKRVLPLLPGHLVPKKTCHLAEQCLNQSEVGIPALIQVFINLSSAFLWKEWVD